MTKQGTTQLHHLSCLSLLKTKIHQGKGEQDKAKCAGQARACRLYLYIFPLTDQSCTD